MNDNIILPFTDPPTKTSPPTQYTNPLRPTSSTAELSVMSCPTCKNKTFIVALNEESNSIDEEHTTFFIACSVCDATISEVIPIV